MIWILLTKLILSQPSIIFHQCTSNIVHLANISTNITDFEISCPNQYQIIDLINSSNIRSIKISEKTKNVSFFCDHNNSEQNLIIYGEPDVYFENNCHLKNLEIHGYPFFHKPVGSIFSVNHVQIYGNPNYLFLYRYESLTYINESNSISPKRKIDNTKFLKAICLTDDQQFANKYCNGVMYDNDSINSLTSPYYIKYSQPKTISIILESSLITFINIFADPQSSKIDIQFQIECSFSLGSNLTMENVDVTITSKTYELDPIVNIPLLKCVNSNIKLQSGPLVMSVSKVILEDSTITDFSFILNQESFYFMANTQQTINIKSLTDELKEIYICNAIVNSAKSFTFTNIDVNLMKAKLQSNLVFEFTIPDCNISIYDNSEIAISRIDDGYSLLMVDSNLVQLPNTNPTYYIQHLEIVNTNVESKLDNIYFWFRVTTSDIEPNITIYSEKMLTLHVANIGSGVVSSNYQITNCILESNHELIPYVFRSFELYRSTIPHMKTIKIQGQIATIGFYDLDLTPEIDATYDYDRGPGEILLHNVWVHFLAEPQLDYVTLENNAKIFNEEIQIKLMKLPFLTFFDYMQMTSAINYIIVLTGKTTITFRNNDFLLIAESSSIAIDARTETSLYSRLSYITELGDFDFINESTISSNFEQIFYSINEGEYGNVQFDKFTHYIDESFNISWKFKTITINNGIIPIRKIMLTDSSTYINSKNTKELQKLDAITLDSLEIAIDSCVYTDFFYLKKNNGLVVHFPSSNAIFEANRTYADPVSLVFYSYEGETKPYDDIIENKCIKSTKNNSFIIDRLNLYSTFVKEQVLLKGLIQVKSLYLESFNSSFYLLPFINGTDCVDKNQIYLNHSLVDDSDNYYYGYECIINLADDHDTLKDVDFKFCPQQVNGKEVRIMCVGHSEMLAQANTANTILYLPNEENRGKIITISLAQFIMIGIIIIVIVVILILIIFAIVCFRYHHGTLIKND